MILRVQLTEVGGDDGLRVTSRGGGDNWGRNLGEPEPPTGRDAEGGY
jgi:hypothetical protein